MKQIHRWLKQFNIACMIFFSCAAPLAWAQENKVEDQVRAELRLFLWQTTAINFGAEGSKLSTANNEITSAEFFVAKDKEFVPVKCETQEYSAPVAYVGPRKFQLFRKGAGTAQNGAPAFEVAAETMLPTAAGRYILFLDGNLKSPRIMVFPYDTNGGGKGQLLLFNATDRGLGVRVGKEKKTLAPNALDTFPVASFTDYQMPLEVFEKVQDSWQQRISTRNAILFDDRNIGILYQTANDKRVAFALLPNAIWEEANQQ